MASKERLEKVADYLEKSAAPDIADEIRKCLPDLEELATYKNIEGEYGIDLITLFKALKDGAWFIDYRDKHIFYAKATLVSKLDGKFECSQENLKFNGFIILDQLYGLGYELKDCGKTWALTREELEK